MATLDSFRSKNRYYGTYSGGFRRFVRCCVILGLSGSVLACYLGYTYIKDAPNVTLSKLKSNSDHVLNIYSSDNQLIYTTQRLARKNVNIKEVKSAKNVVNALLSVEDRDFYKESGVNYRRTAIAAIKDIATQSKALGGSTITQQLIKQTVFSTSVEDKTVERKIQEMYLAEKINQKYSKNQILMFYMNKCYLGNGLYGMQTASNYYFGKNIEDLSVTQAALLVGLVQAPSAYEPYNHPKAATKRRNIVLYTMYDNKKITKAEYKKYCKVDINSDLVPVQQHQSSQDSYNENRLVSDSYLQGVFKQLKTQGIDVDEQLHKDINIVVPMNLEVQKYFKSTIDNDGYFPNDQMQVAVTAIDNKTGQVIAQIGGRHTNVLLGYDRALNMQRSSGSSIKPLLDYTPAFDSLHWNPLTRVNDAPYKYSSGQSVYDWDRKYQGWITVERALYGSRNIPAIKAFKAVGVDNVKQISQKLGLTTDLYESSAIGINVSTLQMADAYTALANNGNLQPYTFISSIDNQPIKLNQTNVYSSGASFMTTSILKKVPTSVGTAGDIYTNQYTQAGKTGTVNYDSSLGFPSNALTDAWYVGYTKGVTIAVWTGYDDVNRKDVYLTENDSAISRKIYKSLMDYMILERHYDGSDWQMPDTLVQSGSSYIWRGNNVWKE